MVPHGGRISQLAAFTFTYMGHLELNSPNTVGLSGRPSSTEQLSQEIVFQPIWQVLFVHSQSSLPTIFIISSNFAHSQQLSQRIVLSTQISWQSAKMRTGILEQNFTVKTRPKNCRKALKSWRVYFACYCIFGRFNICVSHKYMWRLNVCFASFVSTDVLSATNTSRLVRKGGLQNVSVASALSFEQGRLGTYVGTSHENLL